METLQKKYGLITATAMVVGIVIGSGVFFKAEKILTATGGNLSVGILAWVIGGVIMIVCAYNFAVMATKYEKVSGIVDYAEATLGTKYGYFVGWFMATIYYPTLVSVLAWVSARYTCVLIGKDWSIVGPECLAITAFYLIASYALNTLSPILAGKFQVSTTVIKLIPLYAMAIVGTLSGLANGMVMENFATVVEEMDTFSALLTAVCATSFAYEGWIIATSINAELKDAKRNLPKALVRGTFLIMATYILYYVGLSGAVENSILMESGETGAKTAFANIFSNFMGTGLFVFVVISCLGTLNGLMLACTRGLYALSVRNMGPAPDTFKQIDAKTNMPTNASVVGLLFAGIWLLYFYGANLTAPWFGFFSFDSSELPIITIYAMYIPIFWVFMKKGEDHDFFKGKLMPALGILGSLFMIYAAYVSHGMAILAYLIVFFAVQLIGMFYMKRV
ncbi:MAG: APC family permease [Eubacteriales bacterium]|jgi:APA family basic amino acid/polyamine antiporter|nr:APC family permease [Eubacteriales bacterium]